MKIIYTDHLKLRMKLRSIPKYLPQEIFEEAAERYHDTMTGHKIAVAIAAIRGETREYALSFDEIDDRAVLITIHPIKSAQKTARVKSGRWRSYEDNRKEQAIGKI